MIQFNLLPDVKIEFIKARRAKRFTTLVALVGASTSVAILVLLFAYVGGAQKLHISDLNKDIKKYDSQLQSTKDLNKILTIQNQLNSLTGLHDQKPVTTRLFGYITSLTPATANISELHVDFEGGTFSITGSADGLSTVNKFADTLKFTTFKVGEDGEDTKAFSGVVLTEFARDSKTTTYKIDCVFDPQIFDSKNNVTLTVPKIISTRSETEKPTALFGR